MSSWSPTPAPHNGSNAKCGFHVRYEVKESAFGKGLYVLDDIPIGSLVWKYSPGKAGDADVNVAVYTTEAETRAHLNSLATHEDRVSWVDHVYMFEGKLNEILDDGLLFNHSEEPCTGMPPAGEQYCFESTYAIRDIKAGEQLLDDYGLYGYPPWYTAMTVEFGVARDSFVCIKEEPKRPNAAAAASVEAVALA